MMVKTESNLPATCSPTTVVVFAGDWDRDVLS